MMPDRIQYLNMVCDFRNNYLLDKQVRDFIYKYENLDVIWTIEFTGSLEEGSTNAEIKAYTWDESTGKMTLYGTGNAAGKELILV